MKKPVILLFFLGFLMGCHHMDTTPLTDSETKVVGNYLRENLMPAISGGKVYVAVYLFARHDRNLYLWALMEEYKPGSESDQPLHAWSVPVVLSYKLADGEMRILSHSLPRDGSYYSKDIDELFPRSIRSRVMNFTSGSEITSLEEDIRHQAGL